MLLTVGPTRLGDGPKLALAALEVLGPQYPKRFADGGWTGRQRVPL